MYCVFSANDILDAGKADVIMLARELLRNADFVFDAAMGTFILNLYDDNVKNDLLILEYSCAHAELHSVVEVPPQYARAYTRM